MAASASGSESESDMAESDWTAKFGAFTYHGGALEVARRLAPRAPEPWIDLSTGVNPHAYPLPALAPEAWSRLPESEALAKLEAAAARRYGAAAESVIAGPGSQALIHALAHILPAGEAGALGRTYGGFSAAFAAAGWRVVEAKRLEDMERLDAAIVVNPNNPDGRLVPRGELLALHERLARRGALLIVDEAFADFDGEESLAAALPARKRGHLALVRQDLWTGWASSRLRARFAGHRSRPCGRRWGRGRSAGRRSRSGFARLAIRTGSRRCARASARTERGSTRSCTARAGESSAERASFGWRPMVDARAAFERLLAAGILARPFADAPDRLRFGMPGDENAWERLTTVLRG